MCLYVLYSLRQQKPLPFTLQHMHDDTYSRKRQVIMASFQIVTFNKGAILLTGANATTANTGYRWGNDSLPTPYSVNDVLTPVANAYPSQGQP
jgi:hypothetical protein